MDFSRKGIRKQQNKLLAVSDKLYNKFVVLTFSFAIAAIVFAGVVGVSLGLGAFAGIVEEAPAIEGLNVTPRGYSTFVYDTEGNQTARLVSTDSNRIAVTWDMIPQHMKNAFVAIEDERFWTHNGIDIQGLMRAFAEGMSSGRFNQGASTITQQLLKNNVFTDWIGQDGISKWKRKAQEWYLAIELEKSMSKEDILLNYMNTINLGQNTLGVQSASLRYFGKSVSELTLSEAACIAGITQNPSGYNPITNPVENNKRRGRVLKNMLKLGMINQGEYDAAIADDVYSRIQVINKDQDEKEITSYFVDALTDALVEDFIALGYNETQAYTLIYSSGLKIYSTQDSKIQAIADSVFEDTDNFPPYTSFLLNYALTIKRADGTIENFSQEMMETYFKESGNAGYTRLYSSEEDARADIEVYKEHLLGTGDSVLDESVNLTLQPQASLTVSDQRTGYVVAMVGGRGTKTASRTLNRATDSKRQPGSCFKVVSTFAPAIDGYGMTLATTINDAPFAYENGRLVKNHWGAGYRGMYTIRNAIRDSANVVTVKTLTWITPRLGYDYLVNFGISTLVEKKEINGEVYSDIQQALALGGITEGVTNVELNAAYATMANGGVYVKPVYYTKVVDNEGKVLIDNTDVANRQRRVLKETSAYLLTSAMEDVVTKGTGGLANFGTTAIAGKTGTTTNDLDVWFSGYTDYYTATTWVGYDNNSRLLNTGVASRLWGKIMGEIHKNLQWRDFAKPDDIVTAQVCDISGKLPIAGLCDGHVITEIFDKDTVPTESCDLHFKGTVCQAEGCISNNACPFAAETVTTLPPYEPESVAAGSHIAGGQAGASGVYEKTVDENGQEKIVYKTCKHDNVFWTLPEAEAQLQAQAYHILTAAGYPADHAQILSSTYARKAVVQYNEKGTVLNFFADLANIVAQQNAQQQNNQQQNNNTGN